VLFDPVLWLDAFESLRRGRNPPGPDGMTIEELEARLPDHLDDIRDRLREGSFRPGPCLRVLMPQKGGKEREILYPNVRDKWLQRVLHDHLTPILDPYLADSCVAYRKSGGTDTALSRVKEWLAQGDPYYLKTDVASYYPSIRLPILQHRIESVLGAHPETTLLSHMLAPTVLDEADRPVTISGLPIGFPLSPLMANLYLAPIDHWMEEKHPRYLRFGDDILVLGDSPRELEECRSSLELALDCVGLRIKPEKTQTGKARDGFSYLGCYCRDGDIFHRKREPTGEVAESLQPVGRGATAARTSNRSTRQKQMVAHALGEVTTCSDLTSALAEELLDIGEDARQNNSDLDLVSSGHRVFLRTLYLTEMGLSVKLANENIIIKSGDREEHIPFRKVHQIVALGRIHFSTPFLTHCLKRSIPVIFLSHRGHYMGRLESLFTQTGHMAYLQWKCAEDPAFRLKIASAILRGKLTNYVDFLKSRRHKDSEVAVALGEIERALAGQIEPCDVKECFGLEGHLTSVYYSAYSRLFKAELSFEKRSKHPPTDPVNSMLSFGYTLLYNDLRAIMAAHGLDSRIGFFHSNRGNRPALAMDMIEELRAPVVDRMVLRMTNQQVLTAADFQKPENPTKGYLMSVEAIRRFVEEYEKTMRTQFLHVSTGLRLDVRRIISIQVICLKKVIRGKMQNYIPARLL
jgi:CRISP-associated protein Cas1